MLNNKYRRAAKTVPRVPKSSQEQPKTPSRKSPPRPSKEGPRAPKSGPRHPQDGPRPLQEPSWVGLGAILGPKNRKIEIKSAQDGPGSTGVNFLGRFWSPKCPPKRPQDEPKTSQKSRRKMHHFFIALGPVLDRSWGHLGPILGSKK